MRPGRPGHAGNIRLDIITFQSIMRLSLKPSAQIEDLATGIVVCT